jgi:hypothetical protein
MICQNENCLFGMGCPKCGSAGPLRIEIMVIVTVGDDGMDESWTFSDWTDESWCACVECGHQANVKNFRSPEARPAAGPPLSLKSD